MSLKKFIVDKAGQWKHPGKNTLIPNAKGKITMKGVKYPVLGVDDKGNKKLMLPGKEYQFPGNNVFEIPLAQNGIQVKPGYIPAGVYPSFKNTDGSYSNEVSVGMNVDGQELLLPSFWDGKIHNDDKVLARYRKTGEHLGAFNSIEDAERGARLREFMNNEILPYTNSPMKKRQMGGAQDDQQMLLDMIQQYAQGIGADPQQIMEELQAAGPEEQQTMLQEIMAAVQGGMPAQNPYAAQEMQLGGAPEDHVFPPNMQESYSPVDVEPLQNGGTGKQNKGYMNKTNNFTNWLRNRAAKANMQNMMNMHMMEDGSMMMNDEMQQGGLVKAQWGKNYSARSVFGKDKNAVAEDYYSDQYKNMINTLGYAKANELASYFYNRNKPVLKKPSKNVMSSAAIQNQVHASNLGSPPLNNIGKIIGTGFNPHASNSQNPTYTVTGNTTDNTNPDYQNSYNEDVNNDWDGEWYDPNKNTDDNSNQYLSQNVRSQYPGRGYGYGNYGYGYGTGTPYFNFGYSPFQGLFGMIPNMILALGSLGQMKDNPFMEGTKSSQTSIKRDGRPAMNKSRTIKLDYSQDPKHIGDKGEGIKSLEQKKYPNPVMSYDEEIKRLAEENAIRTLGKFKKMPQKFGGKIKAQDGTEIDLENPDYFDLQYNKGIYGQNTDFLPEQDVTYTDPNANYKPAQSAKASDKTKQQFNGFGFATGPYMVEGIISDINAITNWKNQIDQSKADRKAKQAQNAVTKSHSIADKVDRGDWNSGAGLAYGMFRPNQNIYEGPNAFAKKGGTFFNSNFFQEGGENEDMFEDYIEGEEMFLTDEQIQEILDAGGDIEFL